MSGCRQSYLQYRAASFSCLDCPPHITTLDDKVLYTTNSHLRDAQSTEKSVFYGFVSLVSVYRQKNDLWTIFSYSVRLLPPPSDPIALLRLAVFYGQKNRFLDESTDFFVLSSATTPSPPRLETRLFRAR